MMTKRKEIESMAKSIKRKYEYDSDEECDNKSGTWEHKLRNAEMEATKDWALKLTEMANGKHHIGDFLPPDELNKFMQTYKVKFLSETIQNLERLKLSFFQM
jgi:splicing factor 4